MAKKRALIVDDVEQNRTRLNTILQLRGYEVDQAADGMEALTALKGSVESYDIVFSDVMMPNMNGFELLARIKKMSDTKDIPVVMLTSEDKPEDVEKGKQLGSVYYMIKPFNSDKLNEALTAAGLITD